MSRKTYRAKFNPESKNVYGVSLVENPAMEGDFIQFSKNEPVKFAEVDKSKRRIMGLILEPNKLIYRNQGGQEFDIVFKEEDIENVAYNFQKQANQSTSTIGHEGSNIEGVTFVETWLIENPKIDKSTNFGFEYPKGSWMGVMQIDNEEIWLEYVETGKVKGFSIDAFMQLEEVNLNINKMSDKKEDNVILSAIEKGFLELKNSFKPEKPAEKEVVLEKEKPVEKEVSVDFNSDDFIKQMIEELNQIMEPLKDEIVTLKSQKETLETRVLELEKAPATKDINKSTRQLDLKKSYESMTNREKMEYNRLNK